MDYKIATISFPSRLSSDADHLTAKHTMSTTVMTTTSSSLFIDMHEHDSEALYCVMCDETFASQTDMTVHVILSEKHPKCGVCHERFLTQDKLDDVSILSIYRGLRRCSPRFMSEPL
jgi:hypothetical protein